MKKLRYFKVLNRFRVGANTIIATTKPTPCIGKPCPRHLCGNLIYTCAFKYINNVWVDLSKSNHWYSGIRKYCGDDLEEITEEEAKLLTLL